MREKELEFVNWWINNCLNSNAHWLQISLFLIFLFFLLLVLDAHHFFHKKLPYQTFISSFIMHKECEFSLIPTWQRRKFVGSSWFIFRSTTIADLSPKWIVRKERAFWSPIWVFQPIFKPILNMMRYVRDLFFKPISNKWLIRIGLISTFKFVFFCPKVILHFDFE